MPGNETGLREERIRDAQGPAEKRLLILGLGNTLLSDDGLGIYLGRRVSTLLSGPDGLKPDFVEASLGGLALLDHIDGYDHLVIIDAVQTADGVAGQLYCLTEKSLAGTVRLTSVHDINLTTALQLGRRLGMAVPPRVDIYAVEAKDLFTFQESCTPELTVALPDLAARITAHIRENTRDVTVSQSSGK